MGQIIYAALEQTGKRKNTSREVFFAEMKLVVSWEALPKVIEPNLPVADRGRRPYRPSGPKPYQQSERYFCHQV